MEQIGIIYKITNTINGKIYIGQTRISKNKKHIGADKRFKQHIYDAIKYKDHCIKLCRAIRRYGKEVFICEKILECELPLLNTFEIAYIYIYNSTLNGYNISYGGAGMSYPMTEGKRENISKGQYPKLSNVGLEEKYRNGKLVGYRAKRKQNGIQYEKNFTKQCITLEENKKLALQYLNDVKNSNLDKYNSFNRVKNIPRNIYEEYDYKGKIIGYRFQIIYKKNKYIKVFTDKNKNINELFQLALNEKELFLVKLKEFEDGKLNYKNFQKYSNKLIIKKKCHDLPANIKREYANGKVVGYRFQKRINKKLYYKVYKDSKKTLDEKLQLAIAYKKEFENKLSKNNN